MFVYDIIPERSKSFAVSNRDGSRRMTVGRPESSTTIILKISQTGAQQTTDLGSGQRVGLQHVRSAPQIKHKFDFSLNTNLIYCLHYSIKHKSLPKTYIVHCIDWIIYLPNFRYSYSRPFLLRKCSIGMVYFF